MAESMTASKSTGKREYGLAPGGYRLPDDLRLGRVVLRVSDLERSLEYYGTVLGLKVMERAHGQAVLGAQDEAEPLVELREGGGAAHAPMRGRIGLYHFAILLPDRAPLGRFVAHLAEIGARAGASDHLVSEALYLQDPDGLGIEVYADRPRSEWEHRDRQLLMATEPLDLQSVMAAGAGEPWTGMPTGTRIGHVHLHVGDVERASEFYHAALGFDRVVWSYPGALFMSAGSYHHHLGVNTWTSSPPVEGAAGLIEWRIVLPHAADVEAAARSVAGQGHSVERLGPGALLARDPWGIAVRLIAGSDER